MNEQSRIAGPEAATGARFTAREFERMIAAGAFNDMKVELVRGGLERMPPPETVHANWQSRLLTRLAPSVRETKLFGEVGRDLGLKRALYANAGVACYWVVDQERKVTHVYREPVSGEYRSVATVAFDAPLAVPGVDRAITLA